VNAPDDLAGRPAPPTAGRCPVCAALRPYVAIARPDHWFKNVFMALGVALAYFYELNHPGQEFQYRLVQIVWAVLAVCVVASSNYVVNEILDAPTDRHHPQKRFRPIPSGQVNARLAWAEWLLLAAVGLGMSAALSWPFFASALALWLMGVAYNVPPLRTKDLPYVDVLSESINNPLRLLLGWFAVIPAQVPPVSLTIAYWMMGAFFMAAKRFAEYRWIAEAETAGAYRRSFRHYDEGRLLVSMFVYSTASALFLGIFIVRYHVELILSVPLIAGFFGYYMRVTLKPDSAAQNPERLYRERGLMVYLVLCVVVFVVLMFVRIDLMYQWFNVPSPEVPSLWQF
jgi:decaprenyl-phosphate phosphoribosyltransferase